MIASAGTGGDAIAAVIIVTCSKADRAWAAMMRPTTVAPTPTDYFFDGSIPIRALPLGDGASAGSSAGTSWRFSRRAGTAASGGTFLMLAAFAWGELGELGSNTFALNSVLAWAYLVVVGSLVGFSAYAWLLRAAPISLVVTHQYVNPLVAIALGMAFLGERPSPWSLAGAGLVIGAVYVAIRAEFPRGATAGRPANGATRGTPADQTA